MVNVADPWGRRERGGKKKTNATETVLGAPTVEDRDRTAKSLRTQPAAGM
jgi:hypothetical protein